MKLAMLVAYFAIMIAVGMYCRKHATDVHSFVLGGRSVGPWLTAFAYSTSYFSAVIFVGYAGQFGWKYGLASVWIGVGNALLGSLLAWLVLGRRTRVMTQHLNSATMPQFFSSRFNSIPLRVGTSTIIFVFLIPYTASLYNGLSRLFEMAFNINYATCIILMTVLTSVYVLLGGYMATAITDFIQGIIMVFAIIAIVLAMLSINGGLFSSVNLLGQVSDPAASATPGVFASLFGPEPLSLLFVAILTSLGTWGMPQMVQKFYAISSESDIKKGTVISTIFAVVIAGGCYFLGGFGRLFSKQADVAANGFDSIIPTILSNLSPLFIALAVILVLSASMSTLSSLVLTSSSTMVIDFFKPTVAKDLSDRKQLFLIRFLIVIFIAISAVIAIVQYHSQVTFIAQLMGISWGALAGAFLAPFLYGLYWKKTTKAACWASFLVAVIVMVLNMLLRPYFPPLFQSPINTGVCVILLNLLLVPLISLFTQKPDKALVDHAFFCLSPKKETGKQSTLIN